MLGASSGGPSPEGTVYVRADDDFSSPGAAATFRVAYADWPSAGPADEPSPPPQGGSMPASRRLAVAATLAALALTAVPAPAAAEAGTVDVGRLVLNPTAAGYVADVRITVRNTTAAPAAPHVLVTEPVAGSWSGAGAEFCMEAVPASRPASSSASST
jgi:hypothetical protein